MRKCVRESLNIYNDHVEVSKSQMIAKRYILIIINDTIKQSNIKIYNLRVKKMYLSVTFETFYIKIRVPHIVYKKFKIRKKA